MHFVTVTFLILSPTHCWGRMNVRLHGGQLPTKAKPTTCTYREKKAVSASCVLVLLPLYLYSTLSLRAVPLRPVLLEKRFFVPRHSVFHMQASQCTAPG